MKKIITITMLLMLSVTLTFAQESKMVKNKNIKVLDKVENTTAATYDFTTDSGKFYGGANGATEVEAGVWGMIAGDANSSNIITNSDKDPINTDLNASGYYDGDTNMSGIITNSDKDFINSNINKSSQVPN